VPRIVVHPGSAEELVYELKAGANTVGRTRENDVCVLHKSLSRAHARIEVASESIVLVDLGSKNGSWVDGERVTRRALDAAHELRFGDVPALFQRSPTDQPRRVAPTPMLTRSIATDVTRMHIGELVGDRKDRVAASSDRDRDKLRILLKVSQLLSSPAPLDTLLVSVLDLAFEILDIDRAVILMRDAGELKPRVVRTRVEGSSPDAAFSRSIARYVAENSVAALFSDAKADARLEHAGSVLEQSIRTSMCAPLKPRDEVIGVLYVDNQTKPNRFDAEDLDFLSAFANQAAIAVENAMLNERLAHEAVTRNKLLRFFPPAAVPAIMKGGAAHLATVETEATVLFADISDYTEMSSSMKPTEVIELLNAYFPVMAEIVFRHDGTLEKYIGDALLAVWGAPMRHDDDAARAVRAATEMQRAVRALNAGWPGARQIAIHIGVNTGFVAAGNIGSADYIQYATIGDATNVASRICGAAGRGEVVVDAVTAERARAAGIEVVPLGPTTLKGKTEPMPLFRVAY
jgi:adenylate cyclase